MKVEIISRETVKPSFPTPPHLRTFNLSLADQLMPPMYIPFVFFYPFTSNQERIPTAKTSDHLKKSLSETLSVYYPLAGRLKDGFSSVDCNDEGADYIEAHVNCELSKVLEKPEIEVFNRFLPYDFVIVELDPSVVHLGIQVNNFDCGGLAIGMCFLHKMIDASSMATFVKDWASIARGFNEAVSPIFLQDSIFPSRDLSGLFPDVNVESSKEESITASKLGRFVFTGSSIAVLKAKVMSNNENISSVTLNHPTRVDVVSSFIWQRIMAACREKPGSKRLPFVARYMVNVRGRMVPPLPANTIGNIICDTVVPLRNERERELVDLVLQLRETIIKIDGEYLREYQGDEWISRYLEDLKKEEEFPEAESCCFSSLCRLPLYEADFGWGKPVWISYFNAPIEGSNNNVILMDTRHGDGIEAWVTLDEQTMAVLERDEDLLALASSNPNVDGTVFNRSSL